MQKTTIEMKKEQPILEESWSLEAKTKKNKKKLVLPLVMIHSAALGVTKRLLTSLVRSVLF